MYIHGHGPVLYKIVISRDLKVTILIVFACHSVRRKFFLNFVPLKTVFQEWPKPAHLLFYSV